MSFNLKKRKEAQLTDFDVDNLRNLIIQNINVIKGMNPEDAPDAMEQFNLQLENLGVTFQDALGLVPDLQDVLEQQDAMQSVIPQTATMEEGNPLVANPVKAKGDMKMIKSFNLKKAQEAMPPMDPMGLNDSPELIGDELEMREDVGSTRKFNSGADVQNWLQNETNMAEALSYVSGADDGTGKVDTAKEMIEDFYTSMDEPMVKDRDLERKAGQIFDLLPNELKEDEGIPTEFTQFGEINSRIKKIAEDHVKNNKKASTKSFNLKKYAQHKTLDQAIMYGPAEVRKVDPFLRQPVSDWHIIERNKGFGLVVDDVWNIDYETIWRENIMDKFSRPYKDKDGNWVGGYLHKRFEMDKNIPDSTNYQLKPGQIRRPILPEYGNTEARLQAARSKGEIEGAIDKTKPFNWKEASKKKS